MLASKISGIPSVESPGSFNPPSNLNLGSQESPGKTDLSDKDEQLYVEKVGIDSGNDGDGNVYVFMVVLVKELRKHHMLI